MMKTIIEAIEKGDLPALEQQIQSLDSITILNEKINDKGTRLVHLASTRKRYECLDLLLSNGADPNIADETGLTPLHIAAYAGDTALATLLLNYKANINATYCNVNPAYIAYQQGHRHLLRILLREDVELGKIIDYAITQKDAGILFLALLRSEKSSLTTEQMNKIIPLRNAIWQSLQSYLAIRENAYAAVEIYGAVLNQNNSLGFLFNVKDKTSFWRQDAYKEKAKKYLAEQALSLEPRATIEEGDENENLPLLGVNKHKNYQSFSASFSLSPKSE